MLVKTMHLIFIYDSARAAERTADNFHSVSLGIFVGIFDSVFSFQFRRAETFIIIKIRSKQRINCIEIRSNFSARRQRALRRICRSAAAHTNAISPVLNLCAAELPVMGNSFSKQQRRRIASDGRAASARSNSHKYYARIIYGRNFDGCAHGGAESAKVALALGEGAISYSVHPA